MRFHAGGLALTVAVLWLLGCSSAPRSAPPSARPGDGGVSVVQASATPIRIGYMADMGSSAPIGAGMHLGTDLAVEQINAAGGINGRPLQVIYVDPQGDPAQAEQMATALVQHHNVDVLMGGALSPECLVVQQLAMELRVVYVPTHGCAAEEFATQFCNRYTFRFAPVGRQQLGPLVKYIVKTHGKQWAMLYSDYAYGQSQLNAYAAELARHEASITVPVAVPHNESKLASYVKRVPIDGSVSGVIILGLAAGDLTRASLALGHYRIAPRVQVIGSSGRDLYGGQYPDFLKHAVNVQTYLSGQPPNNPYGEAYENAWREIVQRQPGWANVFGGPDKALAFHGYPPYSAMRALKTAMVEANFTGRQDTEPLISALERINIPLGPDAPGGAMVMNPRDHQGAQTVYVYRVANAHEEELLSTVPADQVPRFNTCTV